MSSLGFNREFNLASRSRFTASAVALWMGVLLCVPVCDANAVEPGSGPVQLTVDLDADGRSESVVLDDTGELSIRAGTGSGSRLPLPLGNRYPRISSAQLKTEKLRGGESVLVATGLRTKGQRVALWARLRGGKLVPIYAGPLGPVGTDGEYSAGVELIDGEMFRYQSAPSVERCDGEKRLFLERFVPDGEGKWRPQPDRLLPKVEQSLAVSSTGPSDVSSSPLRIYRLVSASRQVGIDRADLLTAPRELDDGQAQTAWRFPHDATGSFFTWRSETPGRSLRAVRITPATAGQGIFPSSLILSISPTQSWRVSTQATAKPVWLVFPQALVTDCLSITIENPATKEGQSSAIGDISLYSDLEGANVVAVLVGQLVSTDVRTAEAAERTLTTQIESLRPEQGEALLRTMGTAMASAKGSARRRLQSLLLKLGQRSVPLSPTLQDQIVEQVLAAWAIAEIDERPTLSAALDAATKSVAALHSAVSKLEKWVSDGKLSLLLRAEAAAWLVEHAPWPYALGLGKQVVGELRLRTAFSTALGKALHCVEAQDPRFSTALSELARADMDVHWQTLLAEGLTQAVSGCPSEESQRDLSEKLGPVWHAAAGKAKGEDLFAVRHRLLKALTRLGLASPAPLIRDVLRDEKEPELRQLAALALARCRSLDPDLARLTLGDADPGVRTAMLSGLVGRRGDDVSALAAPLLAQDRWPMVRRAASEAMAASCQSGSVSSQSLQAAVADSDESVAGVSLSGLSRCVGPHGLSFYQSVLADEKTTPSVRGQACVLVARYGLRGSRSAQAHQAIRDGIGDLLDDPHAADRSLVAALVCIRSIGEHGDESEVGVLVPRLDRDAPMALRRGAADSLIKICQRQKAAFDKDARKSLTELLKQAAEPSDGLLHGLLPKLQSACGPWSASR